MRVSRRQLLALAGASAVASAAAGLPACAPSKPAEVVRPPLGSGRVIWLQGAACSGCSISLLDLLDDESPVTADELMIDFMVLGFHPTLMGSCGAQAVAAAEASRSKGGYVLVVEGAVPTALAGACCTAWSEGGRERPFVEVVRSYAERATAIVCVGSCASWGGVPAAGAHDGVLAGSSKRLAPPCGVREATGRTTINVAGCPAHPSSIAWAILTATAGAAIGLDSVGRPLALYRSTVHRTCPRHGAGGTERFGEDARCLRDLGCLGPATTARCSSSLWNGRRGWCIDANAPCIGCTEPSFPRVGLGSPRDGRTRAG